MPEVIVIVAGNAEGWTTSTIEVGVPLIVVIMFVVYAGSVPEVTVMVLGGTDGSTI